jgi:hypothetical protein
MPTRTAEAEWKGNLAVGNGNLKLGSGALAGPSTSNPDLTKLSRQLSPRNCWVQRPRVVSPWR